MTTRITKETQTNVEEQSKEQSKEQAEEEPACGICYTVLNNKNTVITTCDHAYCTACFFKWLNRKETCALCRKVLLSDIVVEERLTDLQDVQTELMDNYRCLRVLKKNIKKKRCKKNNLTDDINSLINRQIRMRCLLDQTRSVCRETLAHSRLLKHALELQKESLDLMKNYRNEWEELHTPLPPSPTPPVSQDEEEEEEINIVEMTTALDHMVRLESRRARTALQRMRLARAAAETIEAESSDEDDNNEEAVEEQAAEEQSVEEQAAEEQTAEEDTAEEDTVEEDTVEEDTVEEDTVEEDTADEDDGEIEVDLTVFGTGIPTFDFMPIPRRIVRVPTARNHRQSPMFVFGANTVASASAFEIPTESRGPPTPVLTTIPPPIIEMTRTQIEPSDSFLEGGFEWTPINLEMPATMSRLVARPEMEPASTEEETITDE